MQAGLGAERALIGGGHDQGDGGEGQHGGLCPRALGVEVLLAMAQPAGQHRGAQHQQHIADDRADDRGLDHVVEPGAQRDQGDDELGGVAEGGIEQAARAFAYPGGEMLGGVPHPGGERQDRQPGGNEDPQVGMRREVLERDRDRNEDQ